MRWYLSLGLLAITLPYTAAAETVVRTGEVVQIFDEQQITSDLYAAAQTIVQAGSIGGDITAAAGTVTVSGPVNADVTALAGRVDINTEVGDDVRVIAGDVRIDGTVAGDVFVIGGTVQLLPGAEVAGDVYVFANKVTISGTVGGSVMGRVEQLRIDSEVSGIDVVVNRSLTLAANAVVAGDVRFSSPNDLVRAPEAVVDGQIIKTAFSASQPANDSLVDRLLPGLILLFASLVLYLVGRELVTTTVMHTQQRWLRSSLLGLAIVVATPVVGILLLSTVLGAVVGGAVLGAYILLLTIGYSLAPMICGVILWRLYDRSVVLHPFAILLGVVVLQCALLVPSFGVALVVLMTVVGMGAFAEVSLARMLHRS